MMLLIVRTCSVFTRVTSETGLSLRNIDLSSLKLATWRLCSVAWGSWNTGYLFSLVIPKITKLACP